jgi:phage baseplate assembly protein W
MFKDIYILNEDFSNFEYDKIEVSNEIDIIKQKLYVLLNTSPGEVLNENDFGSNLINYIGQINVNTSEINIYVKNQIKKYIPESLDYDIVVNSYEAEISGDLSVVLDIVIDASKFFVVFR